jgi:hypothetical protein
VICRKRLLAAQNISRIFKNAVWTKDGCATENTYYDEDEDYNPHKDEKSHHLRCSDCHNHVGWYYSNYHDRGQKSKLLYIDRDGNNVMTVHAASPSNSNNNNVNKALAEHEPLMGGAEGYKTLAEVRPWPREKSPITKTKTEEKVLQMIGAESTPEAIKFISTKLGEFGVRAQVENHSLKKELKQTKEKLQEVKQEKERLEDAQKCQICMENDCDAAIEPCGHVCCCMDCADDLPKRVCPMCREPITKVMKVYKP